jgi:lysophospholipase L1-like esterase
MSVKKIFGSIRSQHQRVVRKAYHTAYRSHTSLTSPADHHSIIFLGDSHTQFFQLFRHFHDPRLRNMGVSGDRTDQALQRLLPVLPAHPQKILIEIGVNDLLQGKPVADTMVAITNIITSIRHASPETVIILQNILPVAKDLPFYDQPGTRGLPRVRELNALISQYCQREHITLIDLFSAFAKDGALDARYDSGDGLHLSHTGYRHWAGIVAPHL